MDGPTKTGIWRIALLLLAVTNVSIYLAIVFGNTVATCSNPPNEPTERIDKLSCWDAYPAVMKLLALPYVFQTTWRCVFISEYPTRSTVTNHPLNSVLVARILAAFGEFSYGVQLALGLYTCCIRAHPTYPALVITAVFCIIILDGVGQCFATYGTIMGSNMPFFFEGLVWVGIFSIGLGLAGVSIASVALSSVRGLFLCLVIALMTPAQLYMLLGYCPLCWDAWRREAVAAGSERLLKPRNQHEFPFRKKAWEALTVRVHTQDWIVWRHECTWQTLYFSIGTWSSLGLAALPLQN